MREIDLCNVTGIVFPFYDGKSVCLTGKERFELVSFDDFNEEVGIGTQTYSRDTPKEIEAVLFAPDTEQKFVFRGRALAYARTIVAETFGIFYEKRFRYTVSFEQFGTSSIELKCDRLDKSAMISEAVFFLPEDVRDERDRICQILNSAYTSMASVYRKLT